MNRTTRRKIRRTLFVLSVLAGSAGGGIIGVGVGMLAHHQHPLLGPSLIGFGAAMTAAYAAGIFFSTNPRR